MKKNFPTKHQKKSRDKKIPQTEKIQKLEKKLYHTIKKKNFYIDNHRDFEISQVNTTKNSSHNPNY